MSIGLTAVDRYRKPMTAAQGRGTATAVYGVVGVGLVSKRALGRYRTQPTGSKTVGSARACSLDL
ncbi:hypothetical protein GCM10018965_052450 [Nonomuraea roseola]